MTLCRFYPGEIFFPQQGLRRPYAVVASLKNERIACRSDSRRRVRSEPFGVRAPKTLRRAPRFPAACSASKPELALEQLVHRLRVGLAAGGLQHLPDEPTERLRIGFQIGN